MSNNTERDGRTYINHEVQQGLNELHQENPRAAYAIETAYHAAYPSNDDANNSGDEDERPNWGNTQYRRDAAEARIDAEEQAAGRSDSDPEPDRQATRRRREPMDRDERRRARRAARDIHVSEPQRDILEREFGDRWRRVPAPSGRQWEDTRGIAEGERISRRIYGRSSEAFANTSLEDPLVGSSSQRQPSNAELDNLQVIEERVLALLRADEERVERLRAAQAGEDDEGEADDEAGLL